MVYNQLYAGLFSFIILAQLVHVLYFIFTILKICFLFKLWCHEVFNQSCFEFADCKLERGGGFPVYSSELVYQD